MLTMETPRKDAGASELYDLLNEAKRYGILNISLDDLEGLKSRIMAGG